MTLDTEYAIRQALMRQYERELGGAGRLALTIRALTRTDRDRLAYWSGDSVVNHYGVQRLYGLGDDIERVAIEAAQADSDLAPCVGFVLSDLQARPSASAWLIDGAGNLIDPARSRRPLLGALGVKLRATEAAEWTPTQRHEVAGGDVARMAVR